MNFICKLIDKPVFNYFFEANFEVLLHLLYIKVHKMNFDSLYKDFHIFKDGVFIILLLIISVVVESVFAFII